MMVRDPEQVRIPASVTKTSLGTMDHIALGVPSMKVAYETLYTGDRLEQPERWRNQDRTRWEMAVQYV